MTGNRPFFITRRTVELHGVTIFLQHKACQQPPVELFVPNNDDLTEKRPLRCKCGFEIDFYFSDPVIGRKLVEFLKRPDPHDQFDAATGSRSSN